ncbi:uncharacterized protein PHALS_04675 [Plasmopara halstedii]|uniref:Uncharacterized protein n=1 Tax=Plasmopara halstedii TaxID=4781 RepID=A0A0P1A952_PLAHL|nr:uncharacterized protein PHALS_04675 [Plasmopara halstedii]CEG37233.1 hypothetical protein PHALS_04675 [Plasmopara halstedii]|eukprot:XP_024573602.1 hypothetical protein PHALS_04675 [Plasmopara halstedii]
MTNATSNSSESRRDEIENTVTTSAHFHTLLMPEKKKPDSAPTDSDSDSGVGSNSESFFSYTNLPDIKLNVSTDGSVPPNWVGPTIGDFTDTACYRKTHEMNSYGGCPRGYYASGQKCWAQCPISYPVECFLECIPENDNCVLEIMAKVTNPGYVVLSVATSGLFHALFETSKVMQKSLMCVFNLFNIAEGISRYIRNQQMTTPNGTKEEILTAVYQTDLFLVDLPVAITACMGHTVPRYAYWADTIVTSSEIFVKQLLTNRNMIMSSVDSFLLFIRNSSFSKTANELNAETIANLTALIDSGSKCGFELKRLADRVIIKVGDMREKNPWATNEDIRAEMSQSSIVLENVPTVTNNCMGELLTTKKPYAAYQTRDVLRKTLSVIIDQLIDKSTTDMGVTMSKLDYWTSISNMGLLALSALDPTGIAYTAFNYVQSVCGPTEFIGEIDDGSAKDALGLTMRDKAFYNSHGTWTKKGDGKVELKFVSTDTKNVDVDIYSGGRIFASVRVNSGQNVTWTSTVKELQEKTLYLERWRPSFLGIPIKGSGSLLLWVPRSSEGGHLEMTDTQRRDFLHTLFQPIQYNGASIQQSMPPPPDHDASLP